MNASEKNPQSLNIGWSTLVFKNLKLTVTKHNTNTNQNIISTLFIYYNNLFVWKLMKYN